MARRLVGPLIGAACLFLSSLGHAAACQADNDCAGELICENAVCVAPPPPQPAPVVSPAQAVPPAPPRSAAARAQGFAETTSMAEEPPPDPPPPPRRGERHSQAMFVTGIVITSLAPIGLLVSSVGMLCGLTVSERNDNNGCGDLIIGGLVTTAIFAGVGIPLIVTGAKRDPVATGRVTPWLTPHSAGVGLRFDL